MKLTGKRASGAGSVEAEEEAPRQASNLKPMADTPIKAHEEKINLMGYTDLIPAPPQQLLVW